MFTNKLKYFTEPKRLITIIKKRLSIKKLLSKPTRSKTLVKLSNLIAKPCSPQRWVFIIGCYNSGTTLLQKLISTHPSISSLNEGVFKTSELISPEELGWTRLWYKTKKQVRLTEKDVNIDAEKVKRDWGIFFNHAKPIFLEKSIVNSARMRWLQKNFNNSYFIIIIRNGYAVSEGIRRKAPQGKWGLQQNYKTYSYPIEMCAKQWKINNEIIEKDLHHIKKYKKIKYERLCSCPQKTIEEIWRFLGLKKKVRKIEDQKWVIADKYSKIKNMNQKSFNNLTDKEIKKIEEISKKILEYYNYSLLSKL